MLRDHKRERSEQKWGGFVLRSLEKGRSEQKWGCFVLRRLKKLRVRTKEGWFCADGLGMKATAAGIYGIRLLLTKRCGRLSPRAVLALDSWPKELPFEQNHREKKVSTKASEKALEKAPARLQKRCWKRCRQGR